MDVKNQINNINAYMGELTRSYPGVWKYVDMCRNNRGTHAPDWPDYCYCPQAVAAGAIKQTGGEMGLESSFDILAVCGLSSWRATKGVYQFDPDIFDELVDTSLDGALPIELLYRLPEWCVYVPIPEGRRLKFMAGVDVCGFFSWIDVALQNNLPDRLMFGVVPRPNVLSSPGPPLLTSGINLEGNTLDEAIEGYMRESVANYKSYSGLDVPSLETLSVESEFQRGKDMLKKPMTEVLSLILYLCSTNIDLTCNGLVKMPKPPIAKKTKEGLRLFPAEKITIWETGYRIGSALRAAKQEMKGDSQGGATGRKVTPHARRAHFHTYITGKGSKSDQSKAVRVLKWLPPILVGVTSLDDLIPTVRPVR